MLNWTNGESEQAIMWGIVLSYGDILNREDGVELKYNHLYPYPCPRFLSVAAKRLLEIISTDTVF